MTNGAEIVDFGLRSQINKLETEVSRLKSGDGGGTSGGMDARVAALESDMKDIKADLKALVRDTAEIKGKLSQMPSTLQLIGFVVAVFVASGLVKHFFP